MKPKKWSSIQGGKSERDAQVRARQAHDIAIREMSMDEYEGIITRVVRHFRIDWGEASDAFHALLVDLLVAEAKRGFSRRYAISALIFLSIQKHRREKGRARFLTYEGTLSKEDKGFILSISDGSFERAVELEQYENLISEVKAAIRTLSDSKHQVLRLLLEGKSGREIAFQLRMTPGSVRVAKCEAIRELRKKLGVNKKVSA